jgi:Zn-dependent alcohol dehydrogenases
MRAMALSAPKAPLQMQERDDRAPRHGEIRVEGSACGVCRTDLHMVEAELPDTKYPYPLAEANDVVTGLRQGQVPGATALKP